MVRNNRENISKQRNQIVNEVIIKENNTVPFHSIRQSHVMGPQKLTKCHDGHGHFGEVTKSFLDSKKKN